MSSCGSSASCRRTVHVGLSGAECADQRRKQPCRRALEDADAEDGVLGRERSNIGPRRGEDVADARRAVEQQVTCGCGRDRGRAAWAVEEGHPDDCLECGDLPESADCE